MITMHIYLTKAVALNPGRKEKTITKVHKCIVN